MSESFASPPANSGRAAVASEIDRMVTNGHVHRVTGDAGDISVTVARDGNEPASSTVHRASTPGSDAGRIHDDGVSIEHAASMLQTDLNSLQAKLDATSGYDPKTGVALPQYVGRDRENIVRQLEGLKRTAALQVQQWNALKAQRTADAKVAAQKAEIEKFVGSDPAKAAAVTAELNRRGAVELVDKLFGKR